MKHNINNIGGHKCRVALLTCAMSLCSIAAMAQDITQVHGTVSDDLGPLMGATVCEIDENGRIIEATITDNNGKFTMKFRNKKDKVRISYVGFKTQTLDYQKKKYNVLMKEQNIWL